MDFEEVERVLLSLEEEDLEIQTVQGELGKARVISPKMLVRMKADTVRLKDRQYAARIRQVFNIERGLKCPFKDSVTSKR